MKRYYFVTDNLDDLAAVEDDLKAYGISPLQMHLLSLADAEVDKLGLANTLSIQRTNVMTAMGRGFLTGLALVAALVVGFWLFGVQASTSWMMVSVLCVIVLGFCTWEGGLKGFQEPSQQQQRFRQYLESGKHLFYVDVNNKQKDAVGSVVKTHRHLQPMGSEKGEADWAFNVRSGWNRFLKAAP